MIGRPTLREPRACPDAELEAFARLVREAFGPAPDGRAARIRRAHTLAFWYASPDVPVAVAALKAPPPKYRRDLFRTTGAALDADAYALELGWIYVEPAQRGHGIGAELCRALLDRVPGAAVFATTRSTNAPMQRILEALGFAPVGRPCRRRGEQLRLYVRSAP